MPQPVNVTHWLLRRDELLREHMAAQRCDKVVDLTRRSQLDVAAAMQEWVFRVRRNAAGERLQCRG